MRLEAGKYYMRRDGVIVKCLDIWETPESGYQASVWNPEIQYSVAYSLDGAFFPHSKDIIAEVDDEA